jgi:cytochrome c oxidase cbb3-type subunit 3
LIEVIMRLSLSLAGACLLARGFTATPAAAQGPGRGPATFPAQQRPPGDPALIARGQQLYGVNCQFCHGADLRGGDSGGPNLLRSQLVLNDQDGELIGPLIVGGSQSQGGGMMPAIPLPGNDIQALAAYLHSVQASMRGQGNPPSETVTELNILVGDAAAGKAYFDATCTSCHKASDMNGIGSRFEEPKDLQNFWLRGADVRGRAAASASRATATVTTSSGEVIQGELIRYDDFFVAVRDAGGNRHSFSRRNGVPKVDVDDPADAHVQLLPKYADKNIHDVTAYLVTLK